MFRLVESSSAGQQQQERPRGDDFQLMAVRQHLVAERPEGIPGQLRPEIGRQGIDDWRRGVWDWSGLVGRQFLFE
jgi:hypothetical protein